MEYIADTVEWRGYPENVPSPPKKISVGSNGAIPATQIGHFISIL